MRHQLRTAARLAAWALTVLLVAGQVPVIALYYHNDSGLLFKVAAEKNLPLPWWPLVTGALGVAVLAALVMWNLAAKRKAS